MQSELNEKNTLPVQAQTSSGKAIEESKSDKINVSPFCEFCKSVAESEKHLHDVFTDKYGFAWKCRIPLSCPHAITEGPILVDCMILKNIMKAIPGNLHDVDQRFKLKRTKIRSQLNQELKLMKEIRPKAAV